MASVCFVSKFRCLSFAFLFLLYSFDSTFASQSDQSLKFFVFGDWGGIPFWPFKTPVQIAVSEKIASFSLQLNVDFIMSLGDHFYTKGVGSVDDKRFQETFEEVYNATSLQIPWYAVAGNHDYYGNVSAQLAYSKVSKRWKYPDYYYKESFLIPGSSATVDFIMIDTVILCGHTSLEYPELQPVLKETHKGISEKHWQWLEFVLKQSNATYLYVGGHYPVYSIGTHGNTKCLVDRLSKLLEKYRVTAYFSGHDHNIQHIQTKNDGISMNFFVSGASNVVDPSTKHIDDIPPHSLKFHWGDLFSLGAFCYVEISANQSLVTFIKSSGSVLYKYSLLPR